MSKTARVYFGVLQGTRHSAEGRARGVATKAPATRPAGACDTALGWPRHDHAPGLCTLAGTDWVLGAPDSL